MNYQPDSDLQNNGVTYRFNQILNLTDFYEGTNCRLSILVAFNQKKKSIVSGVSYHYVHHSVVRSFVHAFAHSFLLFVIL